MLPEKFMAVISKLANELFMTKRKKEPKAQTHKNMVLCDKCNTLQNSQTTYIFRILNCHSY